MATKAGRFSGLIRPITYVLDIFTINFLAYLLLSDYLFSKFFVAFISITWVIIAINVEFYEVFRFTKGVSILNKTVKQFILFSIVCFAFSQFYIQEVDHKIILKFVLSSFGIVLFIKLLIFYSLKKYRSVFGGNTRNVIIIGNGKNAFSLQNLFINNPDYGCKVIQFFELKNDKKQQFNQIFDFVLEKNIDIIFCSLLDLSEEFKDKLIDFSENNLKNIKFLPENQELFSENNKIEYYNYIPVLSFYNTYLDDPITKIVKRSFDILFSLIVIIFLLSWLVPILSILIKLESKGSALFLQGRPGIGETEFFCYKFRSMEINLTTEKEASKNDPRVTKIGRFIRKTSIDELPQFWNVLIGDMSVVGPRPHLWSQNKAYGSKINKYMMRHYVKPGITGLAQVSGYRGEIETDEDMIKRINFDVFYIKNWSLILDIKIIFLTVYNIFKGEEKAY